MKTLCPRCQQSFECLPAQVEACACSKIKISPEVYEWVSKNYKECLCPKCLEEIEGEMMKDSSP